MCSRYYIAPGMTEDISRVVQNIDGRIWLAQGDTRPTDVAPVIGPVSYTHLLLLTVTFLVQKTNCFILIYRQNNGGFFLRIICRKKF